MPVINQNWYDLNGVRRYPLDDAALGEDDAGRLLPSGLLVDCRLRFPETAGHYAFLGVLSATTGLVTAIFLASDEPARPVAAEAGEPSAVPIAAVTIPKPIEPGRHYAIEAIYPGTGGWVVFGPGIEEPYTGRFSSVRQGQLLARCARPYRPLPIPSIGKEFVAGPLTGLVKVLGGADIEVIKAVREIRGRATDCLVIRLADDLNRNVLRTYAGPCAGRPESYTCPKPGLELINTVGPDCDGNINIEFRNVTVAPFAGGGGVTLDLPVGLADACTPPYVPDDQGRLPGEYFDLCSSESLGLSSSASIGISESSSLGTSQHLPDCAGLPFGDGFDTADLLPGWILDIGSWKFVVADSPEESYGRYAASGMPGASGTPPGPVFGAIAIPPLPGAGAIAIPPLPGVVVLIPPPPAVGAIAIPGVPADIALPDAPAVGAIAIPGIPADIALPDTPTEGILAPPDMPADIALPDAPAVGAIAIPDALVDVAIPDTPVDVALPDAPTDGIVIPDMSADIAEIPAAPLDPDMPVDGAIALPDMPVDDVFPDAPPDISLPDAPAGLTPPDTSPDAALTPPDVPAADALTPPDPPLDGFIPADAGTAAIPSAPEGTIALPDAPLDGTIALPPGVGDPAANIVLPDAPTTDDLVPPFAPDMPLPGAPADVAPPGAPAVGAIAIPPPPGDALAIPGVPTTGGTDGQVADINQVGGLSPVMPLQYAQPLDMLAVQVDQSLALTDISRRNVMLWDDCGYDYTLGLTCRTQLKMLPGTLMNGGIVINWHRIGTALRPHYHLLMSNAVTNAFELWYYNGTTMARMAGAALPAPWIIQPGLWYEVTAQTRLGATGNVVIAGTLRAIEQPGMPLVNLGLAVTNYLPASGKFGLGTDQAYTLFSFFELKET